jgi:hypothetical protein
MRRRQIAVLAVCGLGLAGCVAGRGQTDLLQARLREQEQRLSETESLLAANQRELKQARHDTEQLRTQLAQAGPNGLLPEQSDLLVRVSGIKINAMLTAGVDRDDVAGDDALFVQFAPHDADGELVKLPGAIEISVLDPALPEAQRTIARWTVPAEESREHWTRGFLGTGYQFTLPWPGEPPQNSELVVHVRMRPADGREFAATHVCRITPPMTTAIGAATYKPAQDEFNDPEFVERLKSKARSVEFSPASGTLKVDGLEIQESTNWTEETMPVRR